MQVVWILLGKICYFCQFYQFFLEQSVQKIEILFELLVEYIFVVSGLSIIKISQLVEVNVLINVAFDNIVICNLCMQMFKVQVQILVQCEVLVLIYGEMGVGKELFVCVIYNVSSWVSNFFIVFNCGVILFELVDLVLFGYKKGVFIGVILDKFGVFQQVYGGILFLDEFGELELVVQVCLLWVLQEGICMSVGGIKEGLVDVCLIIVIYCNLMEVVFSGVFCEDFFYCVVVGVLYLFLLCECEGDLFLLVDILLVGLGDQDVVLRYKKIFFDVKNIILKYFWWGNVRELQFVLLRLVFWCQGDIILVEDICQLLF